MYMHIFIHVYIYARTTRILVVRDSPCYFLMFWTFIFFRFWMSFTKICKWCLIFRRLIMFFHVLLCNSTSIFNLYMMFNFSWSFVCVIINFWWMYVYFSMFCMTFDRFCLCSCEFFQSLRILWLIFSNFIWFHAQVYEYFNFNFWLKISWQEWKYNEQTRIFCSILRFS